MKFNNLNQYPPERRRVFFMIGVFVFTPAVASGIIYFLIPYVTSSDISTLTPGEILAAVAITVTIIGMALKYVDYVLENQYLSERQILLDVDSGDDYTIITCVVENMGKKRVIPQNVYLFVDQGIEKDKYIEFPFCLKHEEGENDCVLGKKCKSGGINSYPEEILPEEYKPVYHRSFNMQNLSAEAIMFIDPGEKFSEDIVLNLDPGIYRATAVWTAVKSDCICATKKFIAPEST